MEIALERLSAGPDTSLGGGLDHEREQRNRATDQSLVATQFRHQHRARLQQQATAEGAKVLGWRQCWGARTW